MIAATWDDLPLCAVAACAVCGEQARLRPVLQELA